MYITPKTGRPFVHSSILSVHLQHLPSLDCPFIMYMPFPWPWPMNLLFAHSHEEGYSEDDYLWPHHPSCHLVSFVFLIFVSFLFFYLIRCKLDCSQCLSDLAQTVAVRLLLGYGFPVPTWTLYQRSKVLKQMLFIAILLLPLRLCGKSLSCLKFPFAVMLKLSIFRLLALCLLSWSGFLFFFSA